MRIVLRLLSWVLIALILYLALWPVPVSPSAWDPPEATGFVGAYASNGKLARYELRAEKLVGPEALAADERGRIFTGTLNGDVVRLGPSGKTQVITNTGGRPLGLEPMRDGSLLVADAYKGLLRVDGQGRVETLVREYKGQPFRFTDDVDLLPDGRVIFTDATRRFDLREFELDALENRPTGRLLVYDPASKRVSVLRDGLHFANGVAVSGDGSFALVNETWAYRVRRVYLTGPKRGRSDVLLDNLPGFPDNITYDRAHDLFWVALASPRDEALDFLAPYPSLRRVVARLPKSMHPKAQHHAMVLAIHGDGHFGGFFDDPKRTSYAPVTSALAVGEWLYMGSLEAKGIARVRLKDLGLVQDPRRGSYGFGNERPATGSSR